MSFVDKINAWLVARIRRNTGDWTGPVMFDAREVRMMSGERVVWSMPWAAIQRVQAFKNPGCMGDSLTMLFLGQGGRGLVSEDISGWKALVEELPNLLPGAEHHASWALRLIAGDKDAIVTVYERPSFA